MARILILLLIIFSYQVSYSNDVKLIIKNSEQFIYKISSKKNNTYTEKSIYSVIKNKDKILYSYKHNGKNYYYHVITNPNGYPHKIDYKDKRNKAILKFNGSGGLNAIINNNVNAVKDGTFLKNLTAENALVVRTLDFNSKEKYIFDLIQCSELPKIKINRMYFQVIGNEKITVAAGTFQCKKIIFSVTGWKGFFFKAYYYISNDQHRYIIKIENMPENGVTELIDIK